jgi:hypothetical protein
MIPLKVDKTAGDFCYGAFVPAEEK